MERDVEVSEREVRDVGVLGGCQSFLNDRCEFRAHGVRVWRRPIDTQRPNDLRNRRRHRLNGLAVQALMAEPLAVGKMA